MFFKGGKLSIENNAPSLLPDPLGKYGNSMHSSDLVGEYSTVS